ncbi:MAG: DUF4360 domain-containing protein [Bacteriovoracales bacterium]
MKYLIFVFMTLSTFADDNFSFSEINLKGTGCKNGTAQIVTSPNDQTISFLFDDFKVEVPNKLGDNDNDDMDDEDNKVPESKLNARLDHKVCNIVLNTNLKADEMVDHLEFDLDFRGFTGLEKGAMARFRARLLTWNGPERAQKKGSQIASKIWEGSSISDNWTISQKVNIPVNSPCSRKDDKNFRVNLKTILQARILKNQSVDSTFATLTMDSSDVVGHMKMRVVTKKCAPRGPNPDRGPRRNYANPSRH